MILLLLTLGRSAQKFTSFCQQNPCSSSPCLNKGTCQAGFTNKGFRCVCRERFTGETCQVEGEMAALCGPFSRVVCASSSLPHDRPFTTSDHDNDHHRNCNCAIAFKGAWWYSACHASNLNGLYLRGNHSSYAYGVNWKGWKGWKGYHYSLERTEMKIRPVNF